LITPAASAQPRQPRGVLGRGARRVVGQKKRPPALLAQPIDRLAGRGQQRIAQRHRAVEVKEIGVE
jgi:hypothetical protein